MKRIAIIGVFLLMGAGCFGGEAVVESDSDVGAIQELPTNVFEPNDEPVAEDPVEAIDVSVKIEADKQADPAEQVKSYSVYDRYLAVPAKYLDLSPQEREDAVSINDKENFFVEFRPLTWDGLGTLAVFLVGDGREIIVFETRGCGPACRQEVYVFEIIDDEWLDKTNELWPDTDPTAKQIENIQNDYVKNNEFVTLKNIAFAPLVKNPQFGIDIIAYEQFSGTVYGKIKWIGDRFKMTRLDTVSENIAD